MTAQTEPNKKKVLVVDDDPADLRYMNKVLKNSYIVIEASNGKEAVTLSQSHKPDIIFMDILMPGMDGYAACHIIKTNSATRDIPMVMLTGVDTELSKDTIENMGADGYITKPFTRERLLDAIGQFLPTS